MQKHRALRTNSEKRLEAELNKAGHALYQRLFAPLQTQLADARLLFIAPDGEINRVPFEALVDDKGKYLIERWPVAYLASGRDLLRTPATPARGTVVFAGPDYDLKSKERQAQADRLKIKVPADAVAVRGGAAPELRGVRWKPLRGAAAEAADVTEALQGGVYGRFAPIAAARRSRKRKGHARPARSHLATHGFFCPGGHDKPEERDAASSRGRRVWPARSPTRCCLGHRVAAALRASGAGEDGWVTAEEIALLDLRGTELVVLSACETGLGDVKVGEGVFGLRRAFVFAGARTLVSSLFEVPDEQTRDMMRSFYAGIKGRKGKLEALRGAQLEMIRQRRQQQEAAHPFFWASFVLVGDPN